MKDIFEQIVLLAESRISEFEEDIKKPDSKHKGFYKGHTTYKEGLLNEIQEAYDEMVPKNIPHLEDELGDIFWNYLCLLHSLQKEGYISDVKRIFERSHKKFYERIIANRTMPGCRDTLWENVKKKQKEELSKEYRDIYGEE